VNIGRNAAAVVSHRAQSARVERDDHFLGVAGESLVDRVVDNVINHVVQARTVIGVADVHHEKCRAGPQISPKVPSWNEEKPLIPSRCFAGHDTRWGLEASEPTLAATRSGRLLRRHRIEQREQQQAGDEPADMGFPGDALLGPGQADRTDADQQVQPEPGQ
jgi:hypothetical protein